MSGLLIRQVSYDNTERRLLVG